MKKIFEYVDQNFERWVRELADFCCCRSVAGDQQGLEETRKWIIHRMDAANIPCRLYPVKGGNALLCAKIAGECGMDTPSLLFYNHYDVVEEGSRELWRNEPFRPRICEGSIYGRGVSDNKGPLLSRIQAIEAILAVTGKLPFNVKFFIEGDEETGSPSLAYFSREQGTTFKELSKADVCLWENGRRDDEGRPWARFGVRGSVSFELAVETAKKDVHARMGTFVPSASWRLIWALASLKNADERITIEGFYEDVLPITENDEKILNAFPYDEKAQLKKLGLNSFLRESTGLELKKQIYMEPSMSVCGLEAGELYKGPRGIVPHKASARLGFYLVANQTPDKVEQQLREHLKNQGFGDIKVTRRSGNIPVRTRTDIPLKSWLEKSAEKVYEKPLVVEPTALGGGPAIYFHQAWPQMPIVGVGPGNINGNHHAPNENLRLDDYKASIKHMIALIYEMAEQKK